VTAGTVRLIGTEPATIVTEVTRLKDSDAAYAEMAQATNPYGDGHSAARCVASIAHLLGIGDRIPEFSPEASSTTVRP
jgi:UDP-N-acetylglucosamine 2-epimerase (non-hydrolysing)